VVIGVQRTILGAMQTKRTCETCHGTGEIPNTSCGTCHGAGIEKKRKTIHVHIPSGVEDGNTLRVRSEGEAVKGGASGDLFVRIGVKPDSRFERDGETIYSEKKIGFTQAALGCVVSVDTVDGKADLKIPEGTQSQTQLRLRGKGVPSRSGRGDHIVIVKVVTPHKLSKEQRKMLETLGLNE
jgi:molecular chaperone DnaJ